MIYASDMCMVLVLLSVLLSLASSRLGALVKIMACQGILVSLSPFFLHFQGEWNGGDLLFVQIMVVIKGGLIPALLLMALRRVAIKREVEPVIGYHASLFFGLLIMVLAVVIKEKFRATTGGNELVLTAAAATMSGGFFLMLGRRKAITQVIGYLMLENGIYLMGTALTRHARTAHIIEFGVLLDLLAGVMIMGIILHNINHAFDDIDTDLLKRLRD